MQYVKAAGALFTVRAMIMAEKRGQQARGVRAEMFAGSRRAKDDGPVGEDIRTALGTWPLEEGQPVDYRKRVLDSDDEEEMLALPEEEQRLANKGAEAVCPNTGSGQTPGGGRGERCGLGWE